MFLAGCGENGGLLVDQCGPLIVDEGARCTVHACATECVNLDQALTCCLDASESPPDRARCIAQVHGLQQGLLTCEVRPAEYFPPFDPDRWVVENVLVTPCTGVGVSGDMMVVSLSDPHRATLGSYTKLVALGCGDWYR